MITSGSSDNSGWLESEAMTHEASPREREEQVEALEQEAKRREPGLAGEFVQFLVHEKKWWLIPIVLVLLLLGLIVVLASTGAGPFIYPLL